MVVTPHNCFVYLEDGISGNPDYVSAYGLAIQYRPYWDAAFVFSDPLFRELKFWQRNIDAFQGFTTTPCFSAHSVLFTDASEFAFGGYSATSDNFPFSSMFPESCLFSSSTFRD